MMRKLLFGLLGAVALALWPAGAWAQQGGGNQDYICIGPYVTGSCTVASATNPLPISGSFSATLTGFAPATVGTPIAVTTGGVTGTLPAGTVIVASNVGTTNDAYCALGGTATTSQQDIPPKSWFAFTVGVATQLTCITSTSTTTVNMVGGSGLPTGSGGGGGGGGSSSNASVSTTGASVPASATYVGITSGGNLTGWTGAVSQSGTWNITNVSGTISLPTGAATSANQVTTPATGNGTTNANTQRVTLSSDSTGTVATTQASGSVASGAYSSGSFAAGSGVDGWNVTEGTKADTACANSGSTCSLDAIGKGILAATQSAIPAGTAIIGKVGIDQTTPGTTNGVALSSINITATDCSSTVATGGTAVNAFTAQTTLHGFTIKNTDASAGSGEPLWISFTTTAAAGTAASYPLAAPATTTFANGESYTTPPGFGLNHALSVVAATSGHKFSCTWW